MTTYRLPEVLGGGEHEAVADVSDYPKVGFDLAGLTDKLWLYRSDLTKVVPPLPDEPGPGAVVLDRDLRAWQYVGDGRGDWCCTVDDLGADWEELNREHGPLTHLVPAPVVEPVTLPWTSEVSLGRRVAVARLGGGPIVSIEDADGTYPTTCHVNAREMAGALMAADAAERAS